MKLLAKLRAAQERLQTATEAYDAFCCRESSTLRKPRYGTRSRRHHAWHAALTALGELERQLDACEGECALEEWKIGPAPLEVIPMRTLPDRKTLEAWRKPIIAALTARGAYPQWKDPGVGLQSPEARIIRKLTAKLGRINAQISQRIQEEERERQRIANLPKQPGEASRTFRLANSGYDLWQGQGRSWTPRYPGITQRGNYYDGTDDYGLRFILPRELNRLFALLDDIATLTANEGLAPSVDRGIGENALRTLRRRILRELCGDAEPLDGEPRPHDGNRTAWAIYCDWLEERGDWRGKKLREWLAATEYPNT